MKRPRSNSRRPSRKWARAAGEAVVMGCLITALVIGSSADRESCAAAPAYQPQDTSTAAKAARTGACLTDVIVASDVGSLGERWRQATGGRERSLRRPNMPGRLTPHKRIQRTLTAPGQHGGAQPLNSVATSDFVTFPMAFRGSA